MVDLVLNGRSPQRPITRDAACSSSLLWTPSALGRWSVAVVFSALAITASWYLSSGQDGWEEQRPYVSLAGAATIVASVGGLSLLLAGRRRIGFRRVALLGELHPELHPKAPAQSVPAAAVQPSSDRLVAGDDLLRYHRSDCPLAAGKSHPEHSAASHRAAGRQPCGVCRP
jgi:hypothetical protein